MTRAFIIVLDSLGVGGAPDAFAYGDRGADTLGHIATLCARGDGDRQGVRGGALRIPHLFSLGLGECARSATGRVPEGLELSSWRCGYAGSAAECSTGKDSQSGHWEIAGAPVSFQWGYFPKREPCFPRRIIDALCERGGLDGILGNRHASGTQIIVELGEAHLRTGMPICYTSADSVFQIAAHEERFGLERLFGLCKIARGLLDPLRIGRVIARPFVGTHAGDFKRTARRRDFGVTPPAHTLLHRAQAGRRDVVAVGKIGDLFAHCATGRELKGDDNDAVFDHMLSMRDCPSSSRACGPATGPSSRAITDATRRGREAITRANAFQFSPSDPAWPAPRSAGATALRISALRSRGTCTFLKANSARRFEHSAGPRRPPARSPGIRLYNSK